MAQLAQSRSSAESLLRPKSGECSWDEFRQIALEYPFRSHIYRGQPDRRRLRTSFHRSDRSDLVRYSIEDIPELYRRLSSRLAARFDLNVPDQLGAFYNLLQHHGYPTPLLDWSESPYVAAWFAFHGERASSKAQGPVRIYAFAAEHWRKFPQVTMLRHMEPHFSVVPSLALENPRAMPQQSVTSFTNVDDIETYL